MKKLILIALAALVVLAGCKKEKETTGTTLKASITQNTSDRTSLHPNGQTAEIHWTAGDKILVNNGTSNATFTLSDGAGTKTGTFTYSDEYTFGASNVAVYPETATINGTTVSFTLPEMQTFTEVGTFGNGANPMLGTFTDPENFTLTSLCGVLGVSLTGDDLAITGIEIVSNTANDKLNGLFEANCTATNPVLAPATGNSGTNRVMLNCAATLTDEAQEFYFVLPVGTLANGFTMNIYGDDTEPIFRKTTTSTALAVELNMAKVMSTVEVTMSESIEEWLYYDNGTYSDAIGTGGSTIYWAVMFPAASIAPYVGTNLTKVAMYEDPSLNTQTITVAIYLGGTTAPQTMVSTQTFNPMGTDGFHEVDLNTPVAVDGTQNMWIVFSEFGTYPATGCNDTGDANGRWISVDGTSWEDIASYGLDYTWMIRGFVTNQAKGGEMVILPEFKGNTGCELNHKPTEKVKLQTYRKSRATNR